MAASSADTPPPEANSTLEELQTDEQRRVLDVVSRIRKFGLNTFLDLPQIVVCGDQSSGKSSVLEALTRIRFPTSDNLCTRFATEINLRREAEESLTVRIVPHEGRDEGQKAKITAFKETIPDLEELPVVMEKAKQIMGIDGAGTSSSAFSLDVLSIDIAGPERPQLSLVDIPGLIQSSTKGVSNKDVQMVGEITDRYISRSRTICLAVISATNDAANQGILQRVRKSDPQGHRTLGVITKVDLLPDGSGSQAKFLELARNEDVVFDLGRHVIRNRKFEEAGSSFDERDEQEALFFRASSFGKLNSNMLGIDTLRARLSQLLFEHVRAELPDLLVDTDKLLQRDEADLALLGESRVTADECRQYLTRLCMDCHDITKSALAGVYHHGYFKTDLNKKFVDAPNAAERLRATLQNANADFAENFHVHGHKYHFSSSDIEEPSPPKEKAKNTKVSHQKRDDSGSEEDESDDEEGEPDGEEDESVEGESEDETGHSDVTVSSQEPQVLSPAQALMWVQGMLKHSRGTELAGNFNPHLIAELFWEQSEKWSRLGMRHVDLVSIICSDFFSHLMERRVPKDVRNQFCSAMIEGSLKHRQELALKELEQLIEDRSDFPINYNHYYTDNICKQRKDRLTADLKRNGSRAFLKTGTYNGDAVQKWLARFTSAYGGKTEVDMQKVSCDEALDCLKAIYKVQQKTFIANVTTQVVERRRDLLAARDREDEGQRGWGNRGGEVEHDAPKGDAGEPSGEAAWVP